MFPVTDGFGVEGLRVHTTATRAMYAVWEARMDDRILIYLVVAIVLFCSSSVGIM